MFMYIGCLIWLWEVWSSPNANVFVKSDFQFVATSLREMLVKELYKTIHVSLFCDHGKFSVHLSMKWAKVIDLKFVSIGLNSAWFSIFRQVCEIDIVTPMKEISNRNT